MKSIRLIANKKGIRANHDLNLIKQKNKKYYHKSKFIKSVNSLKNKQNKQEESAKAVPLAININFSGNVSISRTKCILNVEQFKKCFEKI